MQRLFAALLWLPTVSGLYSSFSMYFSSCFRIFGGMLSLSYVFSLSMNLPSARTFLAVSQSGFSASSTFTASMVIITSGGGLGKALTSLMSALLSESSDFSAFSSAGIAMSRSLWASAWTADTSAACLRTTASSPATLSLITSAFFDSSVTTGTSSSASLIFSTMNGASLVSSSWRLLTTPLASSILSTPVCRRRSCISFSSRFSRTISR
mmetsp:Transcript_18858/g.48375  ORF Transcript_18858/g.48375 Transcript_18858/m.48375 type:complete len:210 (-) Transcript_18858:700-1329(-)